MQDLLALVYTLIGFVVLGVLVAIIWGICELIFFIKDKRHKKWRARIFENHPELKVLLSEYHRLRTEHGDTARSVYNLREAIDDLIFGWLTEDGEVEKVTVDGDEDYSADTWVAADVEVIIYYHTFPQEDSQPEQDTNKDITSETINPSTDQVADGESEKPADTDQDNSVVIPPDNSTFSVKFIDVGQADSALIECDGHYMLIDGGNKGDSSLIYTVLKNSGVSYLDIVVGTHAHEDHIGGLPGAFNYASAELTLCPVTSYDSDAFSDFAKYAIKLLTDKK